LNFHKRIEESGEWRDADAANRCNATPLMSPEHVFANQLARSMQATLRSAFLFAKSFGNLANGAKRGRKRRLTGKEGPVRQNGSRRPQGFSGQ
jgi:hypothetical protein